MHGTMSNTFSPETDLEWSEWKIVTLRDGTRKRVRDAKSTEAWRAAYAQHRERLRSLGYSPRLNEKTGQWSVCQWADLDAEMLQREAEAREASRASDTDLVVPVPEGSPQPFPYQRAGVAYALAQHTERGGVSVLFGDEPGLGKTAQALLTCNALAARGEQMQRILVICPASLKLNWMREARMWSTLELPIGVAKSGKKWPRTPIVIINWDILHSFHDELREAAWDAIIADECHYAKNTKSRRAKHLFGAKRDGIAPIPARHRMLLTGTPIVNRPIEGWPLVHYLRPDEWSNRFKYMTRYCDASSNGYGIDAKGASNLDELQDRLRATCMVRRRKADVLTELPPKVRQVIPMETTGEATAAVKRELASWEAHKAAMRDLIVAKELAKAGEDDDAYAGAVKRLRDAQGAAFSEMSRMRSEVAMLKLPAVISHLESFLEETDQKVIVFAHHRGVQEKLRQHFGERAVGIMGGESMEARDNAVLRFQGRPQDNVADDPSCRVFVGSIIAAGTGLTLTKSSTVVFAELDWVPGNMTQAEDRAHRIGQRDSVLVQHIVLDESLDARMAKVIIEKQRVIDAALDGRGEGTASGAHDDPEVQVSEEAGSIFVVETATGDTRRAEVKAAAKRMPPEFIPVIHEALRHVAAMDGDRARMQNSVGFSRVDGDIGHSLADAAELTPRQAALGLKLVRKYKRQLPEDLVAELSRAWDATWRRGEA